MEKVDDKPSEGIDPARLAVEGVRIHHFHADNDGRLGRLAGTIVTRERKDGKVEVSASIVHPKQGRDETKREVAPSRKMGRVKTYIKLIKGINNGNIFTAQEARRILSKNFDYRSETVRPGDIKVVVFEHDELKRLIRNRQILSLFPGGRNLPKLADRKDFKPRPKKPKSIFAQIVAFFN